MKPHLDALRQSHDGCLVVAYGDAATRLVLRASHDQSVRREQLDQLCDRAADCFRMMNATTAMPGQTEQTNIAMMHSAGATTLFARQNSAADEFLCLVTEHPVDLDALSNQLRTTLDRITA